MAFLNKQERLELLDELKELDFNKAKGKLRKIDPKGRLAYYRNVQQVGKWMTRYELVGMGTSVTLVEEYWDNATGKETDNLNLTEIIVEPRPENRL